MEITWLGHACFRLKGREAVVITDPFGPHLGISLGKQSAQVVTVSHPHPGHQHVEAIGGDPKVIKGPGEYEVAGVMITGIATHHDAEKGQNKGRNIVYLIEMEDVVICHLGDLGHAPSTGQIEQMGNVDVLLIPVGGTSTLSAAVASETISLIEPKVVVPMHFDPSTIGTEGDTLEKFFKEMGIKEIATQPRLMVTKSSLPEVTQIVLLSSKG